MSQHHEIKQIFRNKEKALKSISSVLDIDNIHTKKAKKRMKDYSLESGGHGESFEPHLSGAKTGMQKEEIMF